MGKIMTNLKQLAPELQAIKDQFTKASAEITAKISDLETALSNSDIALPAEAEQLLADLKAIAKGMDDMIPDAPVPEPTADPAPEPTLDQATDPAQTETATD